MVAEEKREKQKDFSNLFGTQSKPRAGWRILGESAVSSGAQF